MPHQQDRQREPGRSIPFAQDFGSAAFSPAFGGT